VVPGAQAAAGDGLKRKRNKMMKMLSALVCASFMMAGVAFAADPAPTSTPAKKGCGCCAATVEACKKCEKCPDCCKKAAAKGKVCKKCHPAAKKKAPAQSS
jgi:hypothetical protein